MQRYPENNKKIRSRHLPTRQALDFYRVPVVAAEEIELCEEKKDEKQGVKMALSISICLITFSSNSDHLATVPFSVDSFALCVVYHAHQQRQFSS